MFGENLGNISVDLHGGGAKFFIRLYDDYVLVVMEVFQAAFVLS